MTEKNYPKFRSTRDIELRFAPQIAIMECGYHHLVRAFGQPTFSASNSDTFEGTEQCAWQIQFESGEVIRIAEERGFGDREHNPMETTRWKVNTGTDRAYNWVKEAIRDANPNG